MIFQKPRIEQRIRKLQTIVHIPEPFFAFDDRFRTIGSRSLAPGQSGL
jgi:hypothetical protein